MPKLSDSELLKIHTTLCSAGSAGFPEGVHVSEVTISTHHSRYVSCSAHTQTAVNPHVACRLDYPSLSCAKEQLSANRLNL